MLLLYPKMSVLDNNLRNGQKSGPQSSLKDGGERRKESDVFVAYKNEGETPLECLNRLKDEGFLPFNDKFTYAGRLDPMAEGLMIFLRGTAIKDKDQYLHLDKEYEIEVLLGVQTDTGDVLGMIKSYSKDDVSFDLKNIQNICESFIGEIDVPYPWFSSKTVNGKALHEWIREDDEELIEKPMTKLSIKNIEFINLHLISTEELLQNITKRIQKVKGDFRQEKILQDWQKINIKNKKDNNNFPIIKLQVKCGSGSYMRTLAETIGEKLKVPALAYSIKRLSVGEYNICG